MPTQCIQARLDPGRAGGRKLVGAFDGGAITSNGGVALLAGADRKLRLAVPSGRPEHCLQGRGCALTAPAERGSPAWHRPSKNGRSSEPLLITACAVRAVLAVMAVSALRLRSALLRSLAM